METNNQMDIYTTSPGRIFKAKQDPAAKYKSSAEHQLESQSYEMKFFDHTGLYPIKNEGVSKMYKGLLEKVLRQSGRWLPAGDDSVE